MFSSQTPTLFSSRIVMQLQWLSNKTPDDIPKLLLHNLANYLVLHDTKSLVTHGYLQHRYPYLGSVATAGEIHSQTKPSCVTQKKLVF